MDDRLNHEQKMFSKTNWEFTKKNCGKYLNL
mgnify:CR=1 FL=1|jgi:hypothetical protein